MTGILRYSPKLSGARISDKWWLIVDCDPEIGRYYRHLFRLGTHRVNTLHRPAWVEHITVIRDEEPPHKHLWEAHAGDEVGFEVGSQVHTDGSYFWLDVNCPAALDIREELGLPRQPLVPLHLSIGHGVG